MPGPSAWIIQAAPKASAINMRRGRAVRGLARLVDLRFFCGPARTALQACSLFVVCCSALSYPQHFRWRTCWKRHGDLTCFRDARLCTVSAHGPQGLWDVRESNLLNLPYIKPRIARLRRLGVCMPASTMNKHRCFSAARPTCPIRFHGGEALPGDARS